MPEEGFLRPEAEILSASSLVPDANLVRPAPTRFSHQVVAATPYSYRGDHDADGELPAGARVLVVGTGANGRCWVVDGRGLRVAVACTSLRELPPRPSPPGGPGTSRRPTDRR